MGAATRAAEAEKATVAYQIAMTKLAASVVAEALLLWKQDMPTTGGPASSVSWLRKITFLIIRRRREARAIGRAYYRLERALRTGYTVADPSDQRSTVTLNDLRTEFRDLAGPGAPEDSADDDQIPVETIPDLDADAERQDREALREIEIDLGNLGAKGLERRLQEIDTERPATEVDVERQTAHDEAGARQAAAAARIVQNGARSDNWNTLNKDKRAIGYIRLSRTGTPCGWCAMLISRGPVYRSKRSAETAVYGDGDLYHDNCNCYAVPVYSSTEYQTSPLYALNREYQEMWPKVTKGLGGKYALTAWRRYIRTTQRAQAARPTQIAQEA